MAILAGAFRLQGVNDDFDQFEDDFAFIVSGETRNNARRFFSLFPQTLFVGHGAHLSALDSAE